jgi:hypothetical protein
MKPARIFAASFVLLAGAPCLAHAELVVFTDGRVVKAQSVQIHGEQIEIRLPDGGGYSVDRSRVEKIVGDEVEGAAKTAGTAPVPVQPSRPHEAAPSSGGVANASMAPSQSAASDAGAEAQKKSPKWSLRRGRHHR